MEDLQNQSTGSDKLQSLLVTAAFILFAGAMVLGIFRGATWGADKATYKNVEAINNALSFYHGDQDRYPSATQFNDQKILVPYYLSAMPTPENASGVCAGMDNFAYSQTKPNNFNLNFCLQRGAYGLAPGTHTLTEKAVQ